MIHWVLDAIQKAGIRKTVVVVGYEADLVKNEIGARSGVQFALQAQQLGTGHAVQMCRDYLLESNGPVLIVAGDSPLIQASSIAELLQEFAYRELDCLLGTLFKDNPQGLGRIVRDANGGFDRIVEEKDATAEQREIREVNMSTYLFKAPSLVSALGQLQNNNAQAEYYLTDCPQLLKKNGSRVDALPVLKPCESLSINTLEELGRVEAKMQEMGYPCMN
jgi:bifunctional UDP-N-acetylglucosamine pyrophosphorylase/glucosamine-1-phosphate N-acetyltransferase/UDP-N-acetylglucosamine pyrophosphorylase